jgi:hypothetical protein
MSVQFNWSNDVSYNENAKRKFHSMARARLRKLAAVLNLPAGSFDIRSNQGGIAVSGEITLHGESIYVQVSQSCIGVGYGIIIRTCKGRKDYTGGTNNWLPLSRLDDIEALARSIQFILA